GARRRAGRDQQPCGAEARGAGRLDVPRGLGPVRLPLPGPVADGVAVEGALDEPGLEFLPLDLSGVGAPLPSVYEGTDAVLVLYNGATRIAKLAPGTRLRVEVI